MKFIILDSTPLGLLTKKPGAAKADAAKNWMVAHARVGIRLVVPEIVDYELRRELLRAGAKDSVARLDRLLLDPRIDYLPLSTPAMRLASELWASLRQKGKPTSDAAALDVDVILAAQIRVAGYGMSDHVVATANIQHLSLLVPAQQWDRI